MNGSRYVVELRIAGAGQRVIVSSRDIGDHKVPIYLVEPEFISDFLQSCAMLHDIPPAFTCAELSRAKQQFYWDITSYAHWRIVYPRGPYTIEVAVAASSAASHHAAFAARRN